MQGVFALNSKLFVVGIPTDSHIIMSRKNTPLRCAVLITRFSLSIENEQADEGRDG